ncbi:probable assembly chaperone of rpl4 [Tachysurus fulvidraco]|uniref:probable assembly chaperone of rpl4 n=1 Tax=Tachysurus fulvidraco TaxID=1234273 RepID=UPI001FED77D3|nr:probable assembly chaperone of rpl4 [Tachysurus fulvidraco]
MGGQAKAKKKEKPKRKENRKGPESTAMSPQDRMKARMQERAKKKTAEKYSIDQLLEKTEECMDNFDFPMAKMFCQRALDIEPTNLTVLDMLGNICAELGDMDKAKQVFLKAVDLSPEEGHSKYMYLGQIHTGAEAVQYFSKGIEVMLKAMDKQAQEVSSMGAAALPSESPITEKDVSVAFCSVAEIFFTDLCMEEGAAERCKEAIEKALHYDQNNPEALQLMASYLFSTEKPEEGRDYLIKSVSSWLPSREEEEECSASLEQDEDEEEEEKSKLPPYESRITTSKLLIEVEEFEMATDVLEGLLEEDDEVVQVWYLLGWLYYLQLDKPGASEDSESLKKSARIYLTKAKKLYIKLHCDDAPMSEHTEQLLGELGGELVAEDDADEAGPSVDDIGDDFIQSSEDEDDADDAMEH